MTEKGSKRIILKKGEGFLSEASDLKGFFP
jgi:hypothetical protein